MYPVIALPLFAPGVKETESDPDPVLVTTPIVGGAGLPTITAAEGFEAGPVPRALVARTVQVYDFAVVRAEVPLN